MCGIAGKVSLGSQPITLSQLRPMAERIIHRGPDDGGFYVSTDKKVGLASRRLAIIDLSEAGHQPMSYLNRYWITFNGEIYNFQTEKQLLKQKGYKFHSGTDTEVILALYAEYGVKCLDHLRGMFAFAIYDNKQQILFLARDRLGKKPLKYYYKNQKFIFCSELKSLFTQPEIKVQPDWTAIDDFLTYGYVPSPNTGFTNVYKLEAGHYLLLDLRNGQLTKKRYWQLDFNQKLDLSETEWCNRILQSLEEAVKLRLIADVPLGAFLSGGIDSSLVVAMMAKLSPTQIKTFSIGFDSQRFDETVHAQRISQLFGTHHTILRVKPQSIETLEELIPHYREPFADNSMIISYLVSQLARQYVTVALNGDGGDENFGGYGRYLKLQRDAKLWPYRKLIPFLSPLTKGWGKLHKYLSNYPQDMAERFVTYNCYLNNHDRNRLYTTHMWDLVKENDSYSHLIKRFAESGSHDILDQALYADINQYLVDDLLVKMDIASMKASLEARSPFLDHHLVELAAKIPAGLKFRHGQTKYILKKAAERLIPKENIYRPKMGFTIPLSEWLEGDLTEYFSSKLLRPTAATRELLDPQIIRHWLTHNSVNNDFSLKLWIILMLEIWLQTYFS